MKKVVLTLGLVAFLFAGGITLETVNAGQSDQVVQDDPPKATSKKSKSCGDYSKSDKCCASKSAKSECKDKEEVKTASVSTTNSEETKKASPDKK
ncbi:MAG: hypothetical protein KDC05_06140 [Bacteroidales bacterium]|nr:hypothetical protein [Bacteroidales bacterium]